MGNNWPLLGNGTLTNVVILELRALDVGQSVGTTNYGTNFIGLAQGNEGIDERRVTEQREAFQ